MKDLPTLLAQMTLEEKAALCSGADMWHIKGIERLGIPSIMVTNGPYGVQKQAGDTDFVGINNSLPATCFPTGPALAATWNRELVSAVGQALGEECRQQQVSVLLGPGINIKRSPLGGRNFDYFSEDPYLTGEIAKSHILGVQSQGVGTSLKHFAVANQEYRRMTIDAVVDERALREIYLAGFETVVKEAHPWTVMCAYNRVNGEYCSENKYLMTDILKGEWGYPGLVVTDWGATNDRCAGLRSGVDLEMPGPAEAHTRQIVAAVRSGALQESAVDRAVERVLQVIQQAREGQAVTFTCDMEAHHALARRAAAEGAVLLKNEGAVLPLPPGAKIALVGRFAKTPRYQGGGSSLTNPTRLENLYEELGRLAGETNLVFAEGYPEKSPATDERLIAEALATAQQADVVVVCVGGLETEGRDRADMKLPPAHAALITAIAAAHPRVVVVLSNGAPLEMPWIDAVPAVLEAYLGGQAGAGAIAEILTGRANPCGKLAETFPLRLEDNSANAYFPGGPSTVELRESIFVGYRHYDRADLAVLFPFGHGLSYTQFEYNHLEISPTPATADQPVTVTFRIRNSGAVAGKEIAQVYVRDVESAVFRPVKELKGFAKIALQPGAEAQVSIRLERRAFAFYDSAAHDWRVEPGEFEILVGASSRDIRLRGELVINAAEPAQFVGADPAGYRQYTAGEPVSQADFEALLGRPAPANVAPGKGKYTVNTPIGDMRDSWIGRLLFDMMRRQVKKMVKDAESDNPIAALIDAMLAEMPLRSMLMMSNGALTRETLDGLLMMMNGRFFRGLAALVRGIRQKAV
ncbi:MAG TPA: glycoside hydrolase family 3 C-terminal domain-containing protein [Anaerolineaceae bacterium]